MLTLVKWFTYIQLLVTWIIATALMHCFVLFFLKRRVVLDKIVKVDTNLLKLLFKQLDMLGIGVKFQIKESVS